jgi:hypothetical protein
VIRNSTAAFKNFLPKLQDHLLGRLIGREFDGDMHEEFTDSDRNSIRFIGCKFYSVQTCHIYYTSYDLQTIPGAKNVRRMDFLWVCWLGEEPGYRSGFYQARLPKIGFVESTDEFAFSFVDPANVVRGCHLIPAFNAGWSADLLPWPHSIARHLNPEDIDDWLNYYVNM